MKNIIFWFYILQVDANFAAGTINKINKGELYRNALI